MPVYTHKPGDQGRNPQSTTLELWTVSKGELLVRTGAGEWSKTTEIQSFPMILLTPHATKVHSATAATSVKVKVDHKLREELIVWVVAKLSRMSRRGTQGSHASPTCVKV